MVDPAERQAWAVQVVPADLAAVPYVLRPRVRLIPAQKEPLVGLVGPGAPVVLVEPLAKGALVDP